MPPKGVKALRTVRNAARIAQKIAERRALRWLAMYGTPVGPTSTSLAKIQREVNLANPLPTNPDGTPAPGHPRYQLPPRRSPLRYD